MVKMCFCLGTNHSCLGDLLMWKDLFLRKIKHMEHNSGLIMWSPHDWWWLRWSRLCL